MTQFGKIRYPLIGLGGTFDHLHDGHKFFLTYASELGSKLVIGITTKDMLFTKRYSNTIQPFTTRVKAVIKFCKEQHIRHEIIKLEDEYGPTILKESKIKALCVTKETVIGAEKINAIREAATFRPLPVYVANMVHDEEGIQIHSVRIRSGKISRDGKVYASVFKQNLVLNDEQKNTLSQPLGKVFEDPKPALLQKKLDKQSLNLPICVVGDESLSFFREHQLSFSLGVFDGHTNRTKPSKLSIELKDLDIPKINNPAGTITTEAVSGLQEAIKGQPVDSFLRVNGEEDLLTAALILLLPLGSVIYYGQPNEGLVEVNITEELKDSIHSLLK